ncbi:DUF2288 domain-containing protein [Pseudohaliea rubra]|uniref:DUF2288 domain-containing protein n=1 Tax=Pseudohaliea rubra DSM 19751 TaxID=1265313 RepID=A0A095X0P2_9GAMM|nr:DUF2288 domain-containing protein [Pseudohaliea rubra]KGE04469.1 hypothetical protein HRUBRA_00934 [Pseudohaliea rubra DSM 19751]
MAEAPGAREADDGERAAELRAAYLGQTARLPWSDLAVHFAGGRMIRVAPALDLVEVAVQLGLDNVARFQAWTEAGEVRPATDDDARGWEANGATLWAVVAAPWVLVQPLPEEPE